MPKAFRGGVREWPKARSLHPVVISQRPFPIPPSRERNRRPRCEREAMAYFGAISNTAVTLAVICCWPAMIGTAADLAKAIGAGP